MVKTFVVLLAVACLAVSSAAQAQMTGTGEGHQHPDEVMSQTPSYPSATAPVTPAKPAPKPISDAEIVGVVQAVDPASRQVTIAYEAAPARNWPPGTMPFEAYTRSLLNGVTVGEKVRFKLDGQQITEIGPY